MRIDGSQPESWSEKIEAPIRALGAGLKSLSDRMVLLGSTFFPTFVENFCRSVSLQVGAFAYGPKMKENEEANLVLIRKVAAYRQALHAEREQAHRRSSVSHSSEMPISDSTDSTEETTSQSTEGIPVSQASAFAPVPAGPPAVTLIGAAIGLARMSSSNQCLTDGAMEDSTETPEEPGVPGES